VRDLRVTPFSFFRDTKRSGARCVARFR
jgi:hypothetical protein